MKHLKKFKSIDDDLGIIESILDDHLDEFPESFTYSISKFMRTQRDGDFGIDIVINYSRTMSHWCPFIHKLYNNKQKVLFKKFYKHYEMCD